MFLPCRRLALALARAMTGGFFYLDFRALGATFLLKMVEK